MIYFNFDKLSQGLDKAHYGLSSAEFYVCVGQQTALFNPMKCKHF